MASMASIELFNSPRCREQTAQLGTVWSNAVGRATVCRSAVANCCQLSNLSGCGRRLEASRFCFRVRSDGVAPEPGTLDWKARGRGVDHGATVLFSFVLLLVASFAPSSDARSP